MAQRATTRVRTRPGGGRYRRTSYAAFVAVAILAAVLAPIDRAGATADTGATLSGAMISGVVADTDGSPIENAVVTVYDYTLTVVAGASTEPSGSYSVGPLTAGEYRVEFASAGYVGEWLDDQLTAASATRLTITDGARLTGIDASLQLLGWIEGKVNDQAGQPVAGELSVGSVVASTDADGNFRLDALESGSYDIRVAPTSRLLLDRFIESVEVSVGKPTLLDIVVEDGGLISGTVTDESGLPLEGVSVSAQEPLFGGPVGSPTLTDNNGKYVLGDGLTPGTYVVEFDSPQGFRRRFYSQSPGGERTNVTVTSGVTTENIDTQLVASAIRGTITDEAGNPVPAMTAKLFGVGLTGSLAESVADEDGRFVFDDPTDGNYTIFFDSPEPYASEWHGNVHAGEFGNDGPSNSDLGDTFRFEQGTERVINVVVERRGSIGGTVTDSAGDPIPGIEVRSFDPIVAATTDSDGRYTLANLDSGERIFSFFDPDLQFVEGTYSTELDGSATPVAVIAGSDTTGIDVVLSRYGSMAGTVTDASGAPLQGIAVRAQSRTAETDSQGGYVIDGLTTGEHRVSFFDPGRVFAVEWYDDSTDFAGATLVQVAIGERTDNIDAVLSLGASIGGRITNADDETLANIRVQLLNFVLFTDDGGRYRFDGLSAGEYLGFVSDPAGAYEPRSFPPDLEQARIVLGPAEQLDVDLVLGRRGQISGTVVDREGRPLPGIEVSATPVENCCRIPTITNQEGRFSTGGLPPGDYQLSATDPTGRHLPIWWDASQTQNDATALTVAEGSTAELILIMDRSAVLAGTVTDQLGAGVHGAIVTLRGTDDTELARTNADSLGRWSFSGLAPAGYLIHVTFTDSLAGQYYGRASSSTDAALISPAANDVITNIDVVLTNKGAVSGTVVFTDGSPAAGALVAVSGVEQRNTFADADGNYSFAGLATGEYTVSFGPPGAEFGAPGAEFVPETYDDRLDATTATPVFVSAESVTSGIDAVLVRFGSISGRVADPDGNPIPGIDIYLDGQFQPGAATDAAGLYRIPGLETGSYRLRFSDPADKYLGAYFGGPDIASANNIFVDLDANTGGVDVTLRVGGSVTGTVVNGAGEPLEAATVRYSAVGVSRSAETDSAGNFTIGALADGVGSLRASAYAHAPQTLAEVSVAVGELTEVANLVLTSYGTLSGVVADETGVPADRISLQIESTDGSPAQFATTNFRGEFGVTLPPGEWRVRLGDPTGVHPTQWYDGAFSPELADLIIVASAEQTVVPITLVSGATISGRVTDSDADPIPYARIELQAVSGPSPSTTESAAADGRYSIAGLAPGSYKLTFSAPGFVSEVYDDQAPDGTATLIVLGVGDSATDTDASLDAELAPLRTSLEGTVTDTSGAPIGEIVVIAHSTVGANTTSTNTITDSFGAYSFDGLDPGTYFIEYGAPRHNDEWYNDVADMAEASPIELADGAQVAGIDAELERSASITGQVVAGDGSPVERVQVTVTDADGATWSTTDDDGRYTVDGLEPGSYTVKFDDTRDRYQVEYYDDASVVGDAEPVLVGSDDVELNAVLDRLQPAISGQVIDTDGNPVSGATVDLYGFSAGIRARTFTDEVGRYSFYGIGEGAYQVRVLSTPDLLGRWNGNVQTSADAPAIEALENGPVANVTIELPYPATLTGSVVNRAGAPLAGAAVEVHEARAASESTATTSVTTTDLRGEFTISPDFLGPAIVEFTGIGPYFGEFYDDVSDESDALVLELVSGAELNRIDTVLSDNRRPTAAIAGDVVKGDAPLTVEFSYNVTDPEGDQVTYSLTFGDGSDAVAGADNSGSVTKTFAEPGEYVVRFEASDGVDRSVVTVTVTVTDGPSRALMIVGSTTPPQGDRLVRDRLVAAGLDVVLVDDDSLVAGLDLDEAALVVLASSVNLARVGSQLTDLPVPLLTWEAYLLDDNDLATRNRESRDQFSRVIVVDNTHPITTGLSLGSLNVYSAASKLSYGTPSPDATVLATVPGRSDRAVVFSYEPGDTLPSGATAQSCRTSLFMDYSGGSRLAAAGIDLIDRVITHALTCGETTGPVDPPAGTDADGDGFTADVDCDDGDPSINPNATEVAGDGVDQDCDGSDLATPPPPGTRAVYVVGSLRPPAGDLVMLDRLLDAGLAVTLVDDNTLGDGLDLDGVAVIVLGSSVKPFVVRDQLAEVAVPLITFEPYVHDDNLLATRPRETSTTFTNIVVSSVEHPITAGVPAGSVAVYTNASKLSYGTPSAAATVLATVPGRPDRAVIFAYNPGDIRTDGTPAPSCRASLFMDYTGAQGLTGTALTIIDNTIAYALACPTSSL